MFYIIWHPHSTSYEVITPSPFPLVLKKGSKNSNCPQAEYEYLSNGDTGAGFTSSTVNTINHSDLGILHYYNATTTSKVNYGTVILKIYNAKYLDSNGQTKYMDFL